MSDVSSKMSFPLSSSLSPFPLTLSRYRWYVNALSNFFWNRESLIGFPCLSRRCSGEGRTIYLELRYHDHTIEIHWTILYIYIQQIVHGDIKCCFKCHCTFLRMPSWAAMAFNPFLVSLVRRTCGSPKKQSHGFRNLPPVRKQASQLATSLPKTKI